jgi:SAM-dependent methyltransferase
MDVRPVPGVDLVWDLTKTPWPLPDNCAHTVVMSHVWEHIPPWFSLAVMEEVHRVCRPAAGVFIAGPYALGFRFVQDPTHCNPVNEATFAYWDPAHVSGLYEVYKPSPFKIVDFRVIPAGNDRDFNCVLSCLKPDQKPPSPRSRSGHPEKPLRRSRRRSRC